MTITEEEREVDDRDSEEPDDDDRNNNDYVEDRDSEMLEDRYRQVDPDLDAKIRAIRQGQNLQQMRDGGQ